MEINKNKDELLFYLRLVNMKDALESSIKRLKETKDSVLSVSLSYNIFYLFPETTTKDYWYTTTQKIDVIEMEENTDEKDVVNYILGYYDSLFDVEKSLDKRYFGAYTKKFLPAYNYHDLKEMYDKFKFKYEYESFSDSKTQLKWDKLWGR